MDVHRLSKNFATKIQENLRPISTHLLPFQKQKSEVDNKNLVDLPNSMKKIDIQNAYKIIKQNANIDNKANIKIITCLKSAQKSWQQYTNSSNKNGQIACTYEIKFKRIDQKFQQQISKLIIPGQLQKIKQISQLFRPMIDFLQKKSRKYKQHQNQFKIKNKKIEEQQKENQEKDDQIKEEMIDLVEKFKIYALNINDNLNNDTTIIRKIGDSQDKQLNSLQNKNKSMEEIVKEQRLGFFQLLWMGIIAVLIWVLGLMFIISI